MSKDLDLDDVAHGNPVAERELAELRLAAKRYEIIRKMSPRAYSNAWELNIKTGKPFDEIIDNIETFLRATR